MYCYKRFTAAAMSAAMLLSLSAGEVYVYKYDSAGNCIGRLLSGDAAIAPLAEEETVDTHVTVFPLETEGDFYISVDSIGVSGSTFSLSSLDGSRTLTNTISSATTMVDISTFREGIYSLGVIHNSKHYSFKIIKK